MTLQVLHFMKFYATLSTVVSRHIVEITLTTKISIIN